MDRLKRLLKKPKSDCEHCRALLSGGLRLLATQLLQGCLAGCPACQLLYRSINPADLADPRIELLHVFYGGSVVCQTFDPGSEEVSLQLRAEGFGKGNWFGPSSATGYSPVERSVELFVPEGITPAWPLEAARAISTTANAPECLALLKSWLQTCQKSHRSCPKIRPTLLPDRVISVPPTSHPRLVETHAEQGTYIALSHRWGGDVPLILTKDKLDSFKREIPFEIFPKTFQDAITVCRALGVGYIWIDSICIIQDSKEDWDVQGSKMDAVYANCLLTIAADAAVNGQAGFLNTPERLSLQNSTRKLVCAGPKGEVGECLARLDRNFGSSGGFGRHYAPALNTTAPVEEGSYLLNRGWVLQETLLPRRMLHFLPSEVTWRCATSSLCECKLTPHDRVVHNPLDLEKPREIATDELREYWKEVVEQYTRRELTFYSDRLAAVAGVASYAHRTSPKVQYHAGLWSDEMPSTLLWTVDRPVGVQRPSKRVEPSVAPTWSWGSVQGCVVFLFWKRNFDRGRWANAPPDLNVVDVSCPPAGKNKYGTVKDGMLTAEGYLCNVQVRLTGGSSWHFPFRMESRREGANKTHGLMYPDTDEFLERMQGSPREGMEFTVVSVYGSRMFLLLLPVEGKERVFERVGVLYCEEKDAVTLPDWGTRERFTLV